VYIDRKTEMDRIINDILRGVRVQNLVTRLAEEEEVQQAENVNGRYRTRKLNRESELKFTGGRLKG
jgi:hypothetical protein